MNSTTTITSSCLAVLLVGLFPLPLKAGPTEVMAVPEVALPSCDGRFLDDFFGLRRPEDTGIDFRLEAVNFYHGLVDGTGNEDLQLGGKLDLFIDIDGQKAGLWPGLFINVHGEFRYGDMARQGGALSPVNAGLISPGVDGEVFALTNVTVTQALSETFLITLGKFNTIDLADRTFYGGRGVESFMNMNFVASPIGGRTFPISTLGAVATILKDGAPFINVGVMDTISPETSPGWDGLSADELTIFADITLTTQLGGKTGWHTLGAIFSTIDATSLDQSDLIQPPNGIDPSTANDSWMFKYNWDQSLIPMGGDPTRGLGSFLFLAVSDADPNPFAFSAAAGLVANGVCAARPCDKFGLGFFYNEISDDLKKTLGNNPAPIPSINVQDELGAEIFYDVALTDWFRIAANVQVVQPNLEDNDTAILAGFRSRITF